MIKSIFISFGILFFSSMGYAEELPRFYTDIRSLGMGGALTAVADDENALVYNPAGIPHREENGAFELLLPTIEASRNITDIIQDIQNIESLPENEKTKQVTDLIGNNIGEQFHLRLSLFPNLLFDRFGMGLLMQATASGAVHNPLSSNAVEGKWDVQHALLVAYAKPLQIRKYPITAGMTLKGVTRYQIFDQGYTIRELPPTSSNKIKQGSGVALDVGFLYPLQGRLRSVFFKAIEFEPTLGLALQNIVGTDLGDAGTLPFQANIGLSLKQKTRWGKIRIAADMMDMTRHVGEDTDFAKRLHMGVEYQLPMMLTLRTGLYQGYPTAGATLDLWIIHMAYAYYVEEMGAVSGQIPNARHVVQLSLF